jgi:hypothetical protein
MNCATRYLIVPEAYCARLGGLAWSELYDAIERSDGTTFALTLEVVSFLEGFASIRPLIHFGHALHCLALLREGERRAFGTDFFTRLRLAYQEAGRPARTAGALCAHLCAAVPPAPDAPSAEDLARWFSVYFFDTEPAHLNQPAQQPALTPEMFEVSVSHALAQASQQELLHWLRHGQAPVDEAGKQVVQALLADRPRSLRGVLADLSQRQRLAGAQPYVAQLVSALALPPRNLAARQLPLGGYADITTRGHPEQMLISQLALDDLELVRRHAENELLYFRREEPHVRTREELVVLLDQGVRTWGPVRLVLAGAVLALGQMAQHRRLPFRLAFTSAGGAPVDPLEVSADELAEMASASDLTTCPGLALEGVLETGGEETRDVVLLTHPRNLKEPDVAAAARRAGGETRLFALAVDAHGSVELSQVRHGAPVTISRFHIDLDRPGPVPAAPPRREELAPWQGDVEPVAFPFRFGAEAAQGPFLFAFDDAGEHLLTASRLGVLHLTRLNGSQSEALPRGFHNGTVLSKPQQIVGVAGGFVVIGSAKAASAFHYDLASRTVRGHEISGLSQDRWGTNVPYRRRSHALVFGDGQSTVELALTSGKFVLNCGNRPPELCRPPHSPGALWYPLRLHPDWPKHPHCEFWPWLHFDSEKGALTLHHVAPPWQTFVPLADGSPLLRGHRLLWADWRENALATLFRGPEGPRVLRVFRGPDGVPALSFAVKGPSTLVVSNDGRLLAYQRRAGQVEVRPTDGGPPLLHTFVGRFHNNIGIEFGGCWLALHFDRTAHLIRWDRGHLVHKCMRGPDGRAALRAELTSSPLVGSASVLDEVESSTAQTKSLPSAVEYDRQRFRSAAWHYLVAVVDAFGQVFLFSRLGDLVCAFFAYRQALAAWMPDGTCYGPAALLGQPETPGAAEKIGQALLAAWPSGGKP